jgi:hypothetical protein
VDISRSQAQMLDLAYLLEEIDSGRVALPEFQRDFDWDSKDIAALIVTVLKGWPAGSLLLMEGKAHFFQVRGFDGGPDLVSDLRYTVLDGQQRLTALYQAICDSGPNVFAMRAEALEDGSIDALDEGVRAFKREQWDRDFRTDPWSHGWIPVYVLRTSSDFFHWRDEMRDRAPADSADDVAAKLSSIYRHSLETVNRYKFPAVLVESTLEASAISRIFERVNRTGLRLSTFDLMVAKLYEPKWNLRQLWDSARRDSRLIDAFLGDDGLAALQILALRYHNDVRDSAVLRLAQPLVKEQWERTIEDLDAALAFVVRHGGVAKPEWLPYRALVTGLAALANTESLEANSDVLAKWYWSRSFGLAFDAAANTRLVAEYAALGRAVRGEEELQVPPASYTAIWEASKRRQGAIWRAFLCVLAHRDAKDLTGESLGLADSLHALEPATGDVQIAPLFATGIDTGRQSEPAHLRVLNLVLSTRSTARRLRNEWASQIAADGSQPDVDQALASQLLPAAEDLERIEENWELVLEARLQALAEHLEEDVGQLIERGVAE